MVATFSSPALREAFRSRHPPLTTSAASTRSGLIIGIFGGPRRV
jgi:hypothetical protein